MCIRWLHIGYIILCLIYFHNESVMAVVMRNAACERVQTNLCIQTKLCICNEDLGGSVTESSSGGRMVIGSKLTGDTALCLSARHFILSLVLFQHRKTGICPNMTEKLFTET